MNVNKVDAWGSMYFYSMLPHQEWGVQKSSQVQDVFQLIWECCICISSGVDRTMRLTRFVSNGLWPYSPRENSIMVSLITVHYTKQENGTGSVEGIFFKQLVQTSCFEQLKKKSLTAVYLQNKHVLAQIITVFKDNSNCFI